MCNTGAIKDSLVVGFWKHSPEILNIYLYKGLLNEGI